MDRTYIKGQAEYVPGPQKGKRLKNNPKCAIALQCTWMSTPQKRSRLPESSTSSASQLLARKAIGLQIAGKKSIFDTNLCNIWIDTADMLPFEEELREDQFA